MSVPARSPSTYSLSGGAWLTKTSGRSDLLRGLNVFVLPAEISRERLGMQSLRELVEERKGKTAKLREDLVKELAEHRDETRIGASLDRFRLELRIKDCDRQAETQGKLLGSLADLEKPGPPLPTHRAWLLYRGAVLSLYDPGAEGGLDDAKELAWMLWDVTAKHASVGTATTGVDGRYDVEGIKDGEYVVYARAESSSYLVEWLEPVSIAARDTSLDLSEGNAARVEERD